MNFENLRRNTLLMTVLLALASGSLGAQQSGPEASTSGSISGVVVDAGSSEPLAGATVVLEPELAAGALSETTGAPFLVSTRAVITDPQGGYRFARLPSGRYRLRIMRAGYRSASVSVELRGAADSRVAIGLTMQPVALEPLEVRGTVGDAFGRQASRERETRGRVAAARARQRQHLSADAREFTYADVLESVTLGETDLFRALQRAAGVAARDDFGADLWVRGASWDQTRVYFDGLPLFNPLHGFGLLSAVNADAVGGAILHPGVRSAALGDAAAGVVDVTSRSGGGTGRIRGLGDLSLTSARLALDQRVWDGRGSWMLAARRSWADLLVNAVGRMSGDPHVRLPYVFADLTGRGDVQIDADRSIELSALLEHDHLSGTVPDLFQGNRARWGNAAARGTYAAPLGPVRARHSAGVSRYFASIREIPGDPDAGGGYSGDGEPSSEQGLTHLSFSGELFPDLESARVLPWRAGYGVVHLTGSYAGPAPYSYGGRRATDAEADLRLQDSLQYVVAWAERRHMPVPGLEVETGLRLEGGPAVENGGPLRVAPRLAARLALGPSATVSIGLGRAYQYSQVVAPTGLALAAGNSSSHLWLISGAENPAIRSDVATAGGELWLSEDWLVSVSGYARHSTGVAIPDPLPGALLERPLFVAGENSARGLELSARRLAGWWTASASYSLAGSEMLVRDLRFPAAEDRRHVLNATSMVRAGSSLRLGAAFTAASGAPYTRVWAPYWSCFAASAQCESQLRVEAPNAQRAPAYASLDLLVDWTRSFSGWDMGAYLQLRNTLGRRNAVTLAATTDPCLEGGYTAHCSSGHELRDDFQLGLPTLPLLGLRVRF